MLTKEWKTLVQKPWRRALGNGRLAGVGFAARGEGTKGRVGSNVRMPLKVGRGAERLIP